jgi:cation transport ATPase
MRLVLHLPNPFFLMRDNRVAAQIVANDTGIDEVYADLLPDDRL